MSIPRRDFMKSLGVCIGSVLLARNAQPNNPGNPQGIRENTIHSSSKSALSNLDTVANEPHPTPTALLPQEPTPEADKDSSESSSETDFYHFNDPNLPPRARLRHCWFFLSWLARRYDEGPLIGEWARDLLLSSHRAALVELIVAGKMCEVIARDVQKGFDAAVNHVQTSNVPIVCYD